MNHSDDFQESNSTPTSTNTIVVDLLFLDLSVCTRCQDTETSLDDSLDSVIEQLNNTGRKVQLNKIHIQTKEQAIKHQFISSPTIRVNGQDIQMEVRESHCSTCSSLTDGASVDCRDWVYNGKVYSAPPKEMISDAILNHITNTQASDHLATQTEYTLPENLVEYFLKKDQLCANVSRDKHDGNNNGCC